MRLHGGASTTPPSLSTAAGVYGVNRGSGTSGTAGKETAGSTSAETGSEALPCHSMLGVDILVILYHFYFIFFAHFRATICLLLINSIYSKYLKFLIDPSEEQTKYI